jgi:hypothetical protein
MNSRRLIHLAVLAVGIGFDATPAWAASDSPAVAEFKEFLSAPPVVESIVFSQRQHPDPQKPSRLDLPLSSSQVFRHYEGRFQQDAFLLRELRDKDAISDLRTTGLLAADDGVSGWFYYGPNSGNKIIEFGSGVTNKVRRSAYVTSYHLRQVLLLGIMRSMPGSVEWNGDKFRVTRSDPDLSAWGNLEISEQGSVNAMHVTYRLGSRDVHWKIRYTYEDGKTTRLPSGIRCFVLQDNAEFEISDFRVHQLTLSSHVMSQDDFRPDKIAAANHWQKLLHTNDAVYLTTKEGTLQRLEVSQRVLPPDEGRNHLAKMPLGVYAGWAGLNLSIFILVWRVRANKSFNQKNKDQNL